MKKAIMLVVALTVVFSLNVVLAKDNPNGTPFEVIWNAITNLQTQIDEIALIPGEPGEDGTDGTDGTDGQDGVDGSNGLNCWDLNGNGIKDTDEDVNSDGSWDALDCEGEKGDQGEQGEDGTDGHDGIDGKDGKTFHLVDANGRDVGILLSGEPLIGDAGINYQTYLSSENVILTYLTKRDKVEFRGVSGTLYFEENNCQGQAYIMHYALPAEQTTMLMNDGTIYRGNNTPGTYAKAFKSRKGTNQNCSNFDQQSWSYWSYPVDKLQTTVWPLVLPLQIVEQ